MEEKRNTFKVCSGIYRKEPLGRGRCGWDEYVKMALNGRELDSVNLINLA